MITASLLLALQPLCAASLAPAVEPAAAPVAADFRATFTAPPLFVEGEPYLVTTQFTLPGAAEDAAKLPVWLLTSAAWLVDGKPLIRRESSDTISLVPGQTIDISLDLGPAITERLDDDGRDFRIGFAESALEPVDVIYLALPERGIDFESLPKEQLGNYQVVLQTSDGPIWMEVWPDVAPNQVRNFLGLCSSGFYDGSGFHRVMPGFMIQGGRAKDGSKAPRTLEAEFNARTHNAGVFSAARLPNDINSASSEFFIVHRKSPHLDGKYTAFGSMILGEDTVEKIVTGVEVHQALVNELVRRKVRLDANNPYFNMAVNNPNPAKTIRQALVVKATKSRPKK